MNYIMKLHVELCKHNLVHANTLDLRVKEMWTKTDLPLVGSLKNSAILIQNLEVRSFKIPKDEILWFPGPAFTVHVILIGEFLQISSNLNLMPSEWSTL